MKLLKYPDPFLFKKVQEVTEFNDELQKNAQEMLSLMKESEGVGILQISKNLFKIAFSY